MVVCHYSFYAYLANVYWTIYSHKEILHFLESEMTLSSSLYVARNLAIGLAFLIAIFMRNASMLFILIIVRLITDLIDAPVFLL